MPRPVFADPKTDFVFKRVFGSEAHKAALIGFLNDVLGLEGDRRIVDVTFLSPEQRPKVSELKHSIVDVKCVDARGTHYVVEMQLLNVEAFEKRVVYNVAKAYTNQLETGSASPRLRALAPQRGLRDPHAQPLAHARATQRHRGAVGAAVRVPRATQVFRLLRARDARRQVAYFFREADSLEVIPPVLQHPPLVEALEAARTARFSADEWDAYTAAGMAMQDERGALSLAHRKGIEQGIEQGRAQELRTSITDLCELLGITPTPSSTPCSPV